MNANRRDVTVRKLIPSLLLAAMLSASTSAATADTASAFKSDHAAWVKEREAELTQPDGWTSVIGLHWINGTQQTVGGAEANDIRLRIGPDKLGKVKLRDGAL